MKRPKHVAITGDSNRVSILRVVVSAWGYTVTRSANAATLSTIDCKPLKLMVGPISFDWKDLDMAQVREALFVQCMRKHGPKKMSHAERCALNLRVLVGGAA